MNEDRFFGSLIGAIMAGILLLFLGAVATAFDFLPDPKYASLITIWVMPAGALVGYAYVAVWSRWRS